MTQAEFDELEAAAAHGRRPLQRDGHRVDDGRARRGARHVAARARPRSRPSTPRRCARRRGDGRARRRARARGAAAVGRSSPPRRFDNAITLLMALGGGTNAVIHLLALAGRVGVPLTLDRFHELSRAHAGARERAPVRRAPRRGPAPRGRRSGASCSELAPLLHGDALTVTGRTLARTIAARRVRDRDVIAPLDAAARGRGRDRRRCAASSRRRAR